MCNETGCIGDLIFLMNLLSNIIVIGTFVSTSPNKIYMTVNIDVKVPEMTVKCGLASREICRQIVFG
jgi:hypothetical protein